MAETPEEDDSPIDASWDEYDDPSIHKDSMSPKQVVLLIFVVLTAFGFVAVYLIN